MNRLFGSLIAISGLAAGLPAVRAQDFPARTIRAGIIGLDTSHVSAFTKIFNKPGTNGDLAGIKVVAGYPGGTNYPPSRDRVGVWKGGRLGTYRGLRRNKAISGAVAFGTDGIVPTDKWGGYEDLCREIARFFKTGKPSVSPEETIEIMAFMEAADRSKQRGGVPVSVADVLAGAKAEAASQSKDR